MKARMKNPVQVIPEAMQALWALSSAADKSGLPQKITWLVQLRASQINGCSVCVDMHARIMRHGGESEERIIAVAAWYDAPYFSDAERAALRLTEALTRISDRTDPVTDELWQEVSRHFGEKELSGLLLGIAAINVWNRLNIATRQVAGEWIKSQDGQKTLENLPVAS